MSNDFCSYRWLCKYAAKKVKAALMVVAFLAVFMHVNTAYANPSKVLQKTWQTTSQYMTKTRWWKKLAKTAVWRKFSHGVERITPSTGTVVVAVLVFIGGCWLKGRFKFLCENVTKTRLRKQRAMKKSIRHKRRREAGKVFGSVFAPSEVSLRSNFIVQVFLHTQDYARKVLADAKRSDIKAESRGSKPLQCKLCKGDSVEVVFSVSTSNVLMQQQKKIVWNGYCSSCSFSYYVQDSIDASDLSCKVLLLVNGVPVGEIVFRTFIVEHPRDLPSTLFSKKYSKIFISYAHQDFDRVKFMAHAYEAQGVDYFFDRNYLKCGDVFPIRIQEYINSADLFILCWSKNAAASEYVAKERMQALSLAYPKVQPLQNARLSLYPLSIEPRAELPSDMKDIYNFVEV